MTEEQLGNDKERGIESEAAKDKLEQLKAAIDKNLAELGPSVTDKDKAKQKELLTKIFLEGLSPKSAMGFSTDFIEAIYGNGYRLFRGGNYKGAEMIFRSLCILDDTDPRFPFGLAACYQKQKLYDLAIEAYYVASIMEPANPLPPFYMYFCYIKLDETLGAYLMLKNAISRLQAVPTPNPTLVKMNTRCEFLLKGLVKYHPEIIEQEENLRKAQNEINKEWQAEKIPETHKRKPEGKTPVTRKKVSSL
jgi:type III secretion system low calcium response chaperone LcrH/SycD